MLSASRRLRLLIVLALLWPVAGALPDAGQGRQPGDHEYAQVHMGLEVRMKLSASSAAAAERAARAAFARIAHLDQMMSDYRPDSELRRLEGNGTAWSVASRELFVVVQRAVEIARATGGAFDPTVAPLVSLWREARTTGRLPAPEAIDAARALVGWRYIELDASRRALRFTRAGMRLDLGGIAKGYILQDALGTLRAHGVASALIEAGGDIVAGDPPPGRLGWSIDARRASRAVQERARALANAALATSGPAEQFVEIDGIRYSHAVDPRTGRGLTNQLTAYVVAADAATADALSTALTIAGPGRAQGILQRFPGVLGSLAEDSR
jgi:FAD:protein FMN transferase